MDVQKDRLRVQNIRFRVLIIGRANAGKTSILQRVCDTFDSPEVYRLGPSGTRHLVRPQSSEAISVSLSSQVKLSPTAEVVHASLSDS